MRLIYGRAGSGKSYYCMNEIKDNIEKNVDNTLIYIVPEQYSLGAEYELSNLLGKNGTIKIQVLSFKRLAYRLFNELGFYKATFSKASKEMLIYHIMLSQERNLKVLKNVNKNRGIVNTIVDLISEFKRYNISYKMLQDININNDYLRLKLDDISLIYKLFEEYVSNEYIDIDSKLSILSKFISKSDMLKNAKVWIDEFDTFTPQEYDVIKELEKISSVTVALTLDKLSIEDSMSIKNDNSLFSISYKTFNKLKQFTKIEEIYLDKNIRFNNKELLHLEKNIFQYPYEKYNESTKHIHISVEANPYKEVENVARIISKKIRDDGLRYENISILTRDIDSHKTIFKRVFSKYNIPYFFDDKKELSMQPLFTLISSLFDTISKNFRYENIFSYLKTGLTNIQDINDIDLIENYVLQYGIKGISKWEKTWEYPHDEIDKINDIRQRIIEPILNFKSSISGKKTVKEISSKLYGFLIETNVYENLKKRVDLIFNDNSEGKISSNRSSELEIANTYIHVWNIFIELLDEIVQCLGNELMTFDTFKNILLQGVSNHSIGVLPTSKDQIMIGDISRTRNSMIKTLFIIGVNDGIFPLQFSSEGFINDKDRDLLLANGIELAKNTKLLLLEDNFNIYKSLTVPSEDIYLSYLISNNDGSALRPSTVINQIKNIFPNIDIHSNILNQSEDFYTSEEAFNPLLKSIRCYYDGKDISSKCENAYLWFLNNEPQKLLKVQSGLDYKNTMEYLDGQHSKKLYGNELYGSVSRLENFANCPFSFFLKYGLKIKDRKVFKLDTPDIGLFLHDIIDEFSKHFIEKGISFRNISREEADKVVSDLVDDALKDFKYNIFNSSNQMKILSSKLKRVVKRMVWIIINHIKSGEFEVEGTEVGFGNDKQFSAVEIELSDGNKLMLTGVIDRIDIAKTEDGKYIRIIDYKSYNKELRLSDIYYGLQLQLLVYLDATLSNKTSGNNNEYINENELLPGGILYLKLDDPIIKTQKNVPIESIEEEIAKKLRMKGVILSDVKLLKAMDSNIVNESSVLDLSIKKDGSYSSKVPAATKEQFDALIKHMKSILKKMGDEILSGNIKNEPIKKKNQTSCDFCDYKIICHFDKDLGNKYRIIHELKNDEVLHNISKE